MGYTVEEANLELQKIINGENPATEAELSRIRKSSTVCCYSNCLV